MVANFEGSPYLLSPTSSVADFLRQVGGCVYEYVVVLEDGDVRPAKKGGLFVSRSTPVDLGDGRTLYRMFLIDEGDELFEPRLQMMERALLKHPSVVRLMRETSPHDMLKEMLCAEIVTDLKAERIETPAEGASGSVAAYMSV